MTPIEQALFCNDAAHCVMAFEHAGDVIAIVLHPWEQPGLASLARFEGVKILSVDDSYADVDGTLPWDVIGFDSELLDVNRWRYCLQTDSIEYCFEAGWPEIDKAG